MDSRPQHPPFENLLFKYSSETDKTIRKQLEKTIWQEYGQEVAVFVLDMSGFSLLSQRFGIVHYLSMVKRMQLTVGPVIKQFKGTIIKFEADNCFAIFEHPQHAIDASLAISDALLEENRKTPDEFDIRIACGIDFGQILVVGDHDFFGNAVNRASKLGEDLANAGELLITDLAFNMVDRPEQYQTSEMDLSISGIEMTAHSISLKH